jgi:hypothetical protein
MPADQPGAQKYERDSHRERGFDFVHRWRAPFTGSSRIFIFFKVDNPHSRLPFTFKIGCDVKAFSKSPA